VRIAHFPIDGNELLTPLIWRLESHGRRVTFGQAATRVREWTLV
jgi:hypothetical protein